MKYKNAGAVLPTELIEEIQKLFDIQSVSQYGDSFLAFGINVLGLSFALASIRRTTKSASLCILFHCIINSLSGIFIDNDNIWSNFASAIIMIIVSLVLVTVNDKKRILKYCAGCNDTKAVWLVLI